MKRIVYALGGAVVAVCLVVGGSVWAASETDKQNASLNADGTLKTAAYGGAPSWRGVSCDDGTRVQSLSCDTNGALNVNATTTEEAVAADGAAFPAKAKAVGGYDGTNLQAIKTDSDGNLQIDILTIAAGDNNVGNVDIASAPTGASSISVQGAAAEAAAVAGNPLLCGGWNGTNAYALKTDTSGELQVDVLTLPALAAGTNNIGDVDVLTLPALAAGTNNIGDVDVLTMPGTAADGATTPAVSYSIGGFDGTNLQSIKTDSDGELQVDLLSIAAGNNNIGDVDVASIAAGNNNIGDVDVASIAAGDNNIGNVDIVSGPTGSSALQAQGTAAAGAAVAGNPLFCGGTDGTNARGLKTDASGELQVDVLTLPALPAGSNTIGNVTANPAALTSGAHGETLVLASAATLVPASPLSGRRAVSIQNLGPNPIYCGFDNTVTTGTGWKVSATGSAGDTLSLDISDTITLYCRAASADQVSGAGTRALETK